MVEDQMVVGCADNDILEETLANDSQLQSFDNKFQFIEALEHGQRAKVDVKNKQYQILH